jgi:hypothetical protein
MHPKDAGMEALRRVKANTIEKRLLTPQGLPAFHLKFYVLNARGDYAGVAMYGAYKGKPLEYAVCTEDGPKTLPVEGLMAESPIEY